MSTNHWGPLIQSVQHSAGRYLSPSSKEKPLVLGSEPSSTWCAGALIPNPLLENQAKPRVLWSWPAVDGQSQRWRNHPESPSPRLLLSNSHFMMQCFTVIFIWGQILSSIKSSHSLKISKNTQVKGRSPSKLDSTGAITIDYRVPISLKKSEVVDSELRNVISLAYCNYYCHYCKCPSYCLQSKELPRRCLERSSKKCFCFSFTVI